MNRPSLAVAFDVIPGSIPSHPYQDVSEQEEERFHELCGQLEEGEFKTVLKALLGCVDLYPWHSRQDKEEMGGDFIWELWGPIYEAIQYRAYDQIRRGGAHEG